MKTKREKTKNYEMIVYNYVSSQAEKGEKISNADIISYVMDETGIVLCDSVVRNMINEMRNNDSILLLLADKKGYFIGSNEKEVREWIKLQQSRIHSMKNTLKSIKRQLRMKKAFNEYLCKKF